MAERLQRKDLMTGSVHIKKTETQLSFDLTLSDLVKKHIGRKPVSKKEDADAQEKAKDIQSLLPSLGGACPPAPLPDYKTEQKKKAEVSLEGALSRWRAAIEWREANKERLMERAKALYKISS